MSAFVVTGSASGIGKACADRLRNAGHDVIGVDLRDCDVIADLGTREGRAAMCQAVGERSGECIDGVVAAAGISSPERSGQTIAINFFGAVATLEGLRPLLTRSSHPRAVAIGSTSALLSTDRMTIDACLAGDEAAAIAEIAARPATAYMTSKRALSLWLRRTAIAPSWAGASILLNGVAPGVVKTAMTAPLLSDPAVISLIDQSNPMAVDGFADPDEIAELITFLLTMESHYLVGQMIFAGGGTDAIMRPGEF